MQGDLRRYVAGKGRPAEPQQEQQQPPSQAPSKRKGGSSLLMKALGSQLVRGGATGGGGAPPATATGQAAPVGVSAPPGDAQAAVVLQELTTHVPAALPLAAQKRD